MPSPRPSAWCGANNRSLNVDKNQMVVDFRRAQSGHSQSMDPQWRSSTPPNSLVFIWRITSPGHSTPAPSPRKAQQRLYFLRRLRKAHLPSPILTMFYRGTIESSCITAWFGNCTVSDRKTLQRTVRTAEKIIGEERDSKANSIVDDPTHPSLTLHPPAIREAVLSVCTV
ncbi:gastrula zinc finger protein XlCGF28.1-like [Silurus meridionalis]|nr:gastrula zinc finger protein XlCGF28.1-like [Silurus meridionalis]